MPNYNITYKKLMKKMNKNKKRKEGRGREKLKKGNEKEDKRHKR